MPAAKTSARSAGAEAGRIKEAIAPAGDRARSLPQHYETDAPDASTLLIPLVRFLPADDERVRATVLAIADELTAHGLVLRYRTDETDDGLSGVEGTFSICSFWLVSALAEIGEVERARKLCERLLNMGGALDLYAEEIEPVSGRQLGNFPQAFTHLALINAVSQVISDDSFWLRIHVQGGEAVWSLSPDGVGYVELTRLPIPNVGGWHVNLGGGTFQAEPVGSLIIVDNLCVGP